MEYFGWTDSVYKAFSKTFPNDYSDESLSFFHKCIRDEFYRSVKSKDVQSLEKLFVCLSDFYKHFCWKINWQNKSPMKRSCVVTLSYLIQVGVILSKGKLSTKWIDSILVAMNVFPGPLELLWDALILVCNVKKKFHPSFGTILRHFFFAKQHQLQAVVSGAIHYFKMLLLLRRLKLISEDKLERAKVIMLALSIPVPRDSQSWLLSHGIKNLANVNLKIFTKMFLSKKLPPEFFKKLRKAFKLEVQSKDNFCSPTADSFIIDNRDESPLGAAFVQDPSQIVVDPSSAFVGKKRKRIELTNIDKHLPGDESINHQLDSESEDNQSSCNLNQNATTNNFSSEEESNADSLLRSDALDSFVIDTGIMNKNESHVKESSSGEDSSKICVDPSSSVYLGEKKKNIKSTTVVESGDESIEKQLYSESEDIQSSFNLNQNAATDNFSFEGEPKVNPLLHSDALDSFVIDTGIMNKNESHVKESSSGEDSTKICVDPSSSVYLGEKRKNIKLTTVVEPGDESIDKQLCPESENNQLSFNLSQNAVTDDFSSEGEPKVDSLLHNDVLDSSFIGTKMINQNESHFQKPHFVKHDSKVLSNLSSDNCKNKYFITHISLDTEKNYNIHCDKISSMSEVKPEWNDFSVKSEENIKYKEKELAVQNSNNDLNITESSSLSPDTKQSSYDKMEESSKHSDSNQSANSEPYHRNSSLATEKQLNKDNDVNNTVGEVFLSKCLQETATPLKENKVDEPDNVVGASNDVSRTNENVQSLVKLTSAEFDICNQNDTEQEVIVSHRRNKLETRVNVLDSYIENVLYKIVDEVAYRVNNEIEDLTSKRSLTSFKSSETVSKSLTFTAVDNFPSFFEVSKQTSINCSEYNSVSQVCVKDDFLDYRNSSTELDANDISTSEFAELDFGNKNLSEDSSSSSDERDLCDDKPLPDSSENFLDENVQSHSVEVLSHAEDSSQSDGLHSKCESKTFTLNEAENFIAKLPQLIVEVGKRCDGENPADHNELFTNRSENETVTNKKGTLRQSKVNNSPTNAEKNCVSNDDNKIVVNQSNRLFEMEVDGIKISEYRIPNSDQMLWKEPVVHLKKLKNLNAGGELQREVNCTENSTQSTESADNTIENNELQLAKHSSQSIPVGHMNQAHDAVSQNRNKPSLKEAAPDHFPGVLIDSLQEAMPTGDNVGKDLSPEEASNPSAAQRRILRPRKAAPDVSVVVKRRRTRKDPSDPVLISNLSQLTLNSCSGSELVDSLNSATAKSIKGGNQKNECQKSYNLRSKGLIQPPKLKL